MKIAVTCLFLGLAGLLWLRQPPPLAEIPQSLHGAMETYFPLAAGSEWVYRAEEGLPERLRVARGPSPGTGEFLLERVRLLPGSPLPSPTEPVPGTVRGDLLTLIDERNGSFVLAFPLRDGAAWKEKADVYRASFEPRCRVAGTEFLQVYVIERSTAATTGPGTKCRRLHLAPRVGIVRDEIFETGRYGTKDLVRRIQIARFFPPSR